MSTKEELIDKIYTWEKRLSEINYNACSFSEQEKKNIDHLIGDIHDKIKELRELLSNIEDDQKI